MTLAGAKHGHGPSNTKVEELKSCLYAVKAAFEFGARIMVIEKYYLSLVHMLRSDHIHDTPIRLYVRDILSFVKRFDFVSWSFVKRGRNRVVHDLTHKQPLYLDGKLRDTDIPGDVLDWASQDIYAYIDDNSI